MKNALRPPLVALAALACGVAASLFAWYLAGRQAQAGNESELAGRAHLAGNLLERRIQRYVDMLYGLEAFAAQRDAAPGREEFHQFAQALELGNRFPGVQAVEFVRRVDRRDLIGGVEIHPPGERDEYWVVDYIEPMAGNEAALGLDIRARSTALAAERARDLGHAEMTARYRLVQETGDSYGLVIYLPVYGLPEPLSESARHEALKGFVNVVLRVDDMMAAMLAEPVLEGMDFWLHDRGDVGGPAQPVSQETLFYGTRAAPPAPARWHEWRPATDLAVQVAGRQWLLRMQPAPLRNPWLGPTPMATLAAGVAMSLLLFGILLTVARSRSEAVEAAAHATSELRTQLSFTQQLIEAIPNPVFFKDAAGRYLGCNQAFEQYVALPRAELIGKTVFDIMPPDFADRSQVFDRELIDRPGTQAYEAQLPAAGGGGRRDVIVNKATFFGPNGELAGLVGVIVDITQRKQLEASTRDSNERLRAIIEASPMAIVARDLNAVIRMWNPAAERLFGWKEEEVLETTTSIVPPHLRDEVNRLRARAEHGETISIEDTQRLHRDGHLVDVSVSVAPVYGGQGQVIGTMVTVADNSRRKQAERALRESEANLRLAMDAAQMGMWYWECDTDRFTCSDGMKALFGRPADAPHEDYRVLQQSLHADDREHFQATMRHAVKHGSDFGVDYRVVWPDGTVHWLTNRGQVYRAPDGRARRLIGMAMDISDRKLAEQRIAHMAHHDALTGLPNRVLLRDRIQQAIAQARRGQAGLAVLFIDLDRFKNINDSLGHELGDRLLQSVASRILVCVREGDTVSRVGGDEFVIVIPGIATASDASAVAAKILEVLGNAFHLHGNDLHVAASIGISLYPSDGEDAETLMRNADTAMYHAKDTGRANFQFFTQHMNVAAQQRLQLETALRRALENREFELEFQPLYDLRDRSITGFEALLRWRAPGGHTVPPAEFIATAEESGLIVPIGDWVLREALRQARTWQGAGREVMVAVNVSANQLSRPRFAERLRRLIDEIGIDPRLVELEVTESVIIEGASEAREAIDQAAALGVGIAIDDFGTGYSGLAYLKRLPIDTVKIDQSFVRDLTVDPDDAAIVTAIVAMARSLGVDVVAEGVETEDQLAELQRLGCHRAQGFLLARPMGGAAVQRLLARARLPVPEA